MRNGGTNSSRKKKLVNKGKNHRAKSNNNGNGWKVEEIVYDVQLLEEYDSQEFRESAARAWTAPPAGAVKGGKIINLGESNNCQLFKSPFNCLQLKSFFQDESYIFKLRKELLGLPFADKSNDLYKFRQSPDLKKITSPAISALRKFLYSDFRLWLTEMTGIELDSTVDMSCAQYSHTDVLLCHDDELEGRRVAYILYLVDEDWNSEDGGGLDLFNVDSNGQPNKITATVQPEWNSLAFFAVTPTSFHQVSEVLSTSKCRLSVSGWFHGKPIVRPPPHIEAAKDVVKPGDFDEDEFYSWINPSYLDPTTQGDVQETFCDKSEIQLQDFLQPDKYAALCEALLNLKDSTKQWIDQGPPNKRHYQCLSEEGDHLPSDGILQKAKEFFRSEAFYLVLSNLTGLKLHQLFSTPSSSDSDEPQEPQTKKKKKEKETNNQFDPCCKLQISKWNSGSYTLLNDQDGDDLGEGGALDLWLFVSADHWQLSHGGQVSYIARGEDEELLTVCPSNNCLALVYRDSDTIRFVKHINSSSGDLVHFSFNGIYYDQPPTVKTV